MHGVDTGDTAWILASAPLVMFMTPGLAVFYGGMVRLEERAGRSNHAKFLRFGSASKDSRFLTATRCVRARQGWPDRRAGFPRLQGRWGRAERGNSVGPTIPHTVFAIFQMMFAIITPALISGAFAERMKFCAYVFLTPVVAARLCPDGPLGVGRGVDRRSLGALDFAGGTVVHFTAGVAALATALPSGKRLGFGFKECFASQPDHSSSGRGSPVVRGRFGFNAGSALGWEDAPRPPRFLTDAARRRRRRVWAVPRRREARKARRPRSGRRIGSRRRPRCDHAGSRIRPDLVVDFVDRPRRWRRVCLLAVGSEVQDGIRRLARCRRSPPRRWPHRADSSPARSPAWPSTRRGRRRASRSSGKQAVLAGVTVAFSFVATLAILKVTDVTVGLRVTDEHEEAGLDSSQHGEVGYRF